MVSPNYTTLACGAFIPFLKTTEFRPLRKGFIHTWYLYFRISIPWWPSTSLLFCFLCSNFSLLHLFVLFWPLVLTPASIPKWLSAKLILKKWNNQLFEGGVEFFWLVSIHFRNWRKMKKVDFSFSFVSRFLNPLMTRWLVFSERKMGLNRKFENMS